ncbi:hypothetical protein FGO68_gene2087 [Halteria grandinella]|uniref:Hexose transporter 1 n=1 Tax=Halteria grandinella TaxID=5974 RepID=A0A8J8NSA6_HALGN|nr:hypothetical protein FGO68_gene2087 [Halteria grandinella]
MSSSKLPNYQATTDQDEPETSNAFKKQPFSSSVNRQESLLTHEPPPDNNLVERTYHLPYVVKLTLISTIGGFLFGYDTGVIAGAQLYFENTWPNIYEIRQTIVSLAQLGAAVGSLMGGPLSDTYGRKATIMWADVLFSLGAIIMGFAPSIAILIVGRFVVGLGVGIGAMVVPFYLGEASPVEIRGKVIACNVLCITSGQFISYLVCIALGDKWRWMLGIAAAPAILQFIGMFFMPETPVFLYKQGKVEEGDKVLGKLYLAKYAQMKKQEMAHEVESIKQESKDPFFTRVKQLFGLYGTCILIGGGLQFWQQFCGINTVMYFGPDILQKAGFGSDDKSSLLIQSLPLALTNALGTIVAIIYIDKLGRRYILLRLIPFIAATLLFLAVGLGINGLPPDNQLQSSGKWLSLVGILTYLIFFSISLGPIPWTVNSEIYPLHLRGVGNSLATTVNWVSNYAVSQVFLLVTTTALGQVITFVSIAVCCVGTWLFVYRLLPETKGRSIESIVEELCPQAGVKSGEKAVLKDNMDQ